VDNSFFEGMLNKIKNSRLALREKWNIPENATCFIFCGKLQEKKRIFDLLKAFEIAHDKNPSVHLLIAGDGEDMQEAKDFVVQKKLPVTFAGFLNQSEIVKAYAAADCLVLPSDYGETWGLVVNEAMACGLPAIVSDRVGCGPDLVIDEVTGYIFPFGGIDALASMLLKCVLDKANLAQMGAESKKLIKDYSVEGTVKGTLEAVKYLLGG